MATIEASNRHQRLCRTLPTGRLYGQQVHYGQIVCRRRAAAQADNVRTSSLPIIYAAAGHPSLRQAFEVDATRAVHRSFFDSGRARARPCGSPGDDSTPSPAPIDAIRPGPASEPGWSPCHRAPRTNPNMSPMPAQASANRTAVPKPHTIFTGCPFRVMSSRRTRFDGQY